MDQFWQPSTPSKKKKPSKHSLIKERLEEEKEAIAEQHAQLKRDFYRRLEERAA